MWNKRNTLLLLLLLALPIDARADSDAKPEPRAETLLSPKAEELYRKGLALYKAEQYPEAVVAFEAAYQINQAPRLLYNLGQAHRKLGHTQDAVDFFDEYLKREPSIERDRRATVEGYIREMRAQLSSKPQLEPAPAAVVPASETRFVEKKPLYKKWWLWATVGGVAVAGLAIGLGVGLRPQPLMQLTNYYAPTF